MTTELGSGAPETSGGGRVMLLSPMQIAKVCHEVNKAYCESLGDMSQPKWEDAADWQVNSALDGISFHLNNPEAGPEASHNNWLKDKEKDGWKYGPEKDVEKKAHPCFVPFQDLPKEQQAKDFLFRQVVHSLASL